MEPIMSLKRHTALSHGMTKFERTIQDRFAERMYQENNYETDFDDEDEDDKYLSS